jgi:hypothetical protein
VIAVTIPSLTTANTFMGNLNPKMSLMISCSPSSKRKDCNISSIFLLSGFCKAFLSFLHVARILLSQPCFLYATLAGYLWKIRINNTLPKALVDAMNRVTEPRKRSRFIAEAVRQKIEQKEKEGMEAIDKAVKIYLTL